MGLFFDPDFDIETKWGYQAQHMNNMSSEFKPNQAYTQLKNLVSRKKSHFVLTSNVDSCFTRSGFDSKFVYTPQGEWTYYQCLNRCTERSVWPSREMLDKVIPTIEKGRAKSEVIPKCPYCGAHTFGNVRGGRYSLLRTTTITRFLTLQNKTKRVPSGNWFIHTPYAEAQDRFVKWAEKRIKSSDRVVVIEIGAGFNTPTVTRYPCESFVRELGKRGALVRINPSDPDVPKDLIHAVGLKHGWNILTKLLSHEDGDDSTKKTRSGDASAACALKKEEEKISGREDKIYPTERWKILRSHWGHFDWRIFMKQLR